jgi:hypothetical protein
VDIHQIKAWTSQEEIIGLRLIRKGWKPVNCLAERDKGLSRKGEGQPRDDDSRPGRNGRWDGHQLGRSQYHVFGFKSGRKRGCSGPSESP